MGPRVNQALEVSQVQKVSLVHEVLLAFQADKVHQAQMVKEVHKVNQVQLLVPSTWSPTNLSSEKKSSETSPTTHTSSDAIMRTAATDGTNSYKSSHPSSTHQF